jgi:acetyl-CoA acetyltransferase family protein
MRAENLARIWNVPREAQDRYALDSHRKAVEAQLAGRFDDEIVAVDTQPQGGPERRVERDEQPRPDTSLDKLAALPPAFKKDGCVTAGNSSPTNDGAAMLVLTSAVKARALGLKPLAAVGPSAVAGVDPTIMPAGPIPATRKLLARTGLTMADFELVEFNEAFAVQLLVCCKELSIPPGIVNVHGGSIALGHPLGCSGARILVTLVHAMQQRGVKRALATVGVGVGQGQSMMIESA